MSDENTMIRRRKRVKRLKIYLVTIFLLMTITPSVASVFAINHLTKLQKNVDELTDRLNEFQDEYKANQAAQIAKENEETKQAVETKETEQLHYEYYEENYVVPEDFKRVYLTFDDGPSIYTSQIMDILDSYGVKATFFVTGNQANVHPEWYKEIVDRGHSIGMHSYTHVYKSIYESEVSFEYDLKRIHETVETAAGVDCKLYRFPGGSSNEVSAVPMQNLCKMVKDNGWNYFDWNVSSQDASNVPLRSVDIVNNVVFGIAKNDRSVVLMHDAGDKYSTVLALPIIIERIMAMDKTVILPIDESTPEIQHLSVPAEMLEDTGAGENEEVTQ